MFMKKTHPQPTKRKNHKATQKTPLKRMEMRVWGKDLSLEQNKTENYHEYVTYSSQYSLMPLLEQLRFNSLSLLWALSLYKISTLFHTSSPCLRGQAGAAARALCVCVCCAVLVLEMVSLGRELVHEISRIRKKKIIYCSASAPKQVGWLTANPI